MGGDNKSPLKLIGQQAWVHKGKQRDLVSSKEEDEAQHVTSQALLITNYWTLFQYKIYQDRKSQSTSYAQMLHVHKIIYIQNTNNVQLLPS